MNIKTQLLFLLLIGCITTNVAHGQEKTDTLCCKNELGVAAGFTTGYGISYRHWFNQFGIQTTFAPYADENNVNISLGISFLQTFIEAGKIDFFVYQGNHFRYNRRRQPTPLPGENEEITEEFLYNTGVGMGIKFPLFVRNIGLNLMVGYAAYDNFSKVNLTAEGGLYFRF